MSQRRMTDEEALVTFKLLCLPIAGVIAAVIILAIVRACS